MRPGPLTRRASLAYFRAHPLQLMLGIMGLTLGVAIIVAIHATRESARAAYDLTADALNGRATHRIVAEGPGGVSPEIFMRVRRELGLTASAPVVSGSMRLYASADAQAVTGPELQRRGLKVRLVGIDPLSEGRLRPRFADDAPSRPEQSKRETGGKAGDAVDNHAEVVGADFIARAGTADRVWMNAATARRIAGVLRTPVEVDSELIGYVAGRPKSLRVAGILSQASWMPDQVLFTDVAVASRVLETDGRLSRVDLRIPRSASRAALLAEIGNRLPTGLRLETAADDGVDVGEMTGAFYTNLTALGLLALLVGMFLVFSTQSFLVTQRRELFGTLRALGVTRSELARLVLLEALLLGLIGAALGVGAGVLLSHAMLGAVATTLNDLYFEVAINALVVPPMLVVTATTLAVGAAVTASLLAVWRAGRTPAEQLRRAAAEPASRRAAQHALWVGIGLVGLSGMIVAVSGRSLVGGFAGLFCLALGAALGTPALLVAILEWLSARVPGRLVALAQATRLSRNSVSRTGVACAALMLAAATGIGVSIMVASFRTSVDDWLHALLRADLYAQMGGADAALGRSGFSEADILAIERRPEVAFVTTVRRARMPARFSAAAYVPSNAVAVDVVAYRVHRPAFDGFVLLEAEASGVFERFQAGQAVMVSEPFANRYGVRVGDTLHLSGAGDAAASAAAGAEDAVGFRIAAVYRDYGSERGVVAMSRAGFAQLSDDAGADGLGLYAAPGADETDLKRALSSALGAGLVFDVTSSRALRERSLEVFDRTFVVTGVLRNIALLIACAGMFSALLALALERQRILATYRALGADRALVFRMTLIESTLTGGLASLLAVPVGGALAWGLIAVINVRAFGWSMGVLVPFDEVLQVVALATLAAALAAVVPAFSAARVRVSEALLDE